MSHKLFDHKNWERLISKEREERMNPEKLFSLIRPNLNQVWLDVGSGPGFYTIPLARRVKKVIALDISPEMLEILKKRADEQHIDNIDYLEMGCPPDPDRIPNLDGVMMINVIHEIEEPVLCLQQIGKKLNSNGMLIIVDWKAEPMEMGPPLDHRLTKSQIKEIVDASGFTIKDYPEIYNYHDVYFLEKVNAP